MRVITGIAKGRKLKAPKGMETRPTSDRVKEALFNILGSKVYGSKFLDLYAGTGSIGIEALSRGAKEAVFVEDSPKAFNVIIENLNKTGFSEGALVLRQDVQRALNILGKKQEHFDFVFIDPPYLKNVESMTLETLQKNHLLRDDSIVVVERSSKDHIPDRVRQCQLYREEAYGDTTLSFYRVAGFNDGSCT